MRTKKSIEGVGDTEYVYENGLLLQMQYLYYIFDFSYGADGRAVGFSVTNTDDMSKSFFYYALNSRGDVIALYNSAGTKICTYSYDAYGKLLSTALLSTTASDRIASNFNPLRYRSYVYDRETGFYYLQSRYYDPTTCRFVNGDDPAYMGIGSINSYNLYSYCSNNPISFCDTSGTTYTYSGYTSTGKYFTGVPTYQLGYLGQLSNYWLDVDSDSFPIGAAITISNDFDDLSWSTIFGGIETGTSDENTIYGDFEKPVTLFSQFATEWWRLSEYKSGVSINIYGCGPEISSSPLSKYVSYTAKNFKIECQKGIDKVGFTVTFENDYQNHKMGRYIHCYYRPWTVAPVVAVACCTYGAASLLLFAPSLCPGQ